MRTRLGRRDVLLRTMAMAGAGAIAGTSFRSAAGPFRVPSGEGQVDAVLQAKVDAAKIPGVVAMAATERSVVYEGAFGVRNTSTAAKMSTDTVFRIASMVKLLTSVAALQLVELGKLELDAPAARIDPTLEAPQVLVGFNAQGSPELRPARRPITLRNLLSHTSGFSYQLWDANVARYIKSARNHPALPSMPLVFDPQDRWAYGSSLDHVGRLVEIVSGKPLNRFFRDHILDPLGMRDTDFVVTEDQRARQASLHVRKPDGTLVAQPLEKRTVPKIFSGGAGIYSTAPDYLTLLQALLNGGSRLGRRILRPETVTLMSTNQIGNLEAGILKTTNPVLSNDVDFFPGVRLRWGLGNMINLDPVQHGRKAGSLTWAGLYNTYYWIDSASGIAGVIMMQILPFADRLALETYRQFEHRIYHVFGAA